MQELWRLDRELFRWIHVGWHQAWLDGAFQVLSWTGLGGVQAGALLLLALKRECRSLAWGLFLAGAASGLVRLAIMQMVSRLRPSNFAFAHPIEQTFGRTSFPSGHTTTSFAIAIMLIVCLRGTGRTWIGLLALAWASLVGISRIYLGVHFPTDVLGGAFLGMAGAGLATIILKPNDREQKSDAVEV